MRYLLVVCLAAIALAGGPATPAQAVGPCTGASQTAPTHLLVWILENHALSASRGVMPYLDSVANGCSYATHYSAITHPSLPNYIAFTSGSTQGITDDASPSSHPLTAPSIFSQLPGRIRSYHQGMPSNCALTNGGTNYIVHHNPWAYFTNVRTACLSNDVNYTHLATDLAGTPADVMLVVPNNCNNGHKNTCANGDGQTDLGTALQADNYLKAQLPGILASAAYQSGSLGIIITWDEGDGTNQLVYTVFIAPGVQPGTTYTTTVTHYGLLRMIEDRTGVGCIANSCTATPVAVPGL